MAKLKHEANEFSTVHNKQNTLEARKNKGAKSARLYFFSGTSVMKEDKHQFYAKLKPIVPEDFKLSDLAEYVGEANKFFDILSNHTINKISSTSCTSISFPLKYYRPVGGLLIPAAINITSSVKQAIGEVSIDGLSLSFKNSPIGTERVDVDIYEGKLIVKVVTGYKVGSTNRLFEKSLSVAKETANLFVVKRDEL